MRFALAALALGVVTHAFPYGGYSDSKDTSISYGDYSNSKDSSSNSYGDYSNSKDSSSISYGELPSKSYKGDGYKEGGYKGDDYSAQSSPDKYHKYRKHFPGESPEHPVYVQKTPTVVHTPLFPSGVELTSRQLAIFQGLIGDMLESLVVIKKACPSIADKFKNTIKLWDELYKLTFNYKAIHESKYVSALDSLLHSLRYLPQCKEHERKALKRAATKLLYDNIFLAGFFKYAYYPREVPAHILGPSGEIVGILIHFLQIDVRYPLHVK